MKIRFLLIALCALMVRSSLFAQTFELGGIRYTACRSDRFYDHAVYVVPQEDGVKYQGDIVIPEKFTVDDKEYWVVGIGDEAFKDCAGVTSVKFEGIIEWIGNSAFENCTGLKNFTIPPYYSDTAYQGRVYLGHRAFWGCHLTSLTCMIAIPPCL